ncbi:MAG: TonB-dependent receptor [Flavobacteriaceae bacterium]|jgi:hypothetical protein|nr:TonB-dependent receptor [Flavobacteriaceae bacterium]
MRFILSFYLAIFLFGYCFPQPKVTVNFKIMDKDSPSCNEDTLQRNILFQYRYEDGYKDVKNFVSYLCNNSYAISKATGNFRILISASGYEPQTLYFDTTEQSPDVLYLGDVFLSRVLSPLDYPREEKEIQGVTITGIRDKYVKFEADKTTYTVKNNDILSGGSTEDALTKIPGVIKGYGGELTANGKSMSIYIDNAPTGLSGADLENLLQSIPASSVEKIEIITNPGAAYEANTGGGIINIITNGRALNGINGTASLNYRFNEITRVSPSLNLNTRIKNVSLQMNTGFNYREWDRTTIYNRDFTSFTPPVVFDQTNMEDGYNRYYFFRPSANIRLNNRSNLLFNYNFNYAHNNVHNTGKSLNPGHNYINLLNDSRYLTDHTNHEAITSYKTQLDSLGTTFNIIAYYSHFDKNSPNKSVQDKSGVASYSINDISSKYNNFYVKTNFEFPFKKLDLTLTAGGKYSITNSSSLGKYNLLNSSPDILNSSEYNSYLDFDYDEHQYALYSEAEKTINKLSITAGLRYENLEYKSTVKQNDEVKHSLDKFYPSLSFLYKFNPVINMNAFYRKSISLPAYSNLDPNIVGYYDEYNISKGNQYLQPDFYDNYEVSVSAFNYLRLSFQYTYSKNFNLLFFETEKNSLTVNQTTRSFGEMKNYNVSLGVPIPFGLITRGKKFFDDPIIVDKMSFIYLYGMYNYYKVDNYPYVEKVTPFWIYAFYSQILLPLDLKLTAFYLFSSNNSYFRIYKTTKPFSYSNMELSRLFYNKSLKISFGVANLFNPNVLDADITSPYLNTHFYQKDKSKLYYFKLSYDFGKRNVKKENTLIESDKPENSLLPSTPLK